jgi:hypothetical protein
MEHGDLAWIVAPGCWVELLVSLEHRRLLKGQGMAPVAVEALQRGLIWCDRLGCHRPLPKACRW